MGEKKRLADIKKSNSNETNSKLQFKKRSQNKIFAEMDFKNKFDVDQRR